MLLTRRAAMRGLGCGAVTLIAPPASGQPAYPNRTIKMIVPYPPGGTTTLSAVWLPTRSNPGSTQL
jgi:tripartite-type tricarboxylate transporter receptor subunit TctC